VLMIAEPFRIDGKFHQDYIRVLPPQETARLIDESLSPKQRWQRMPRLQRHLQSLLGVGRQPGPRRFRDPRPEEPRRAVRTTTPGPGAAAFFHPQYF